MSTDFYTIQILPYASIIIKICRAYTNSQEDFEDYYQEVCLQIWRTHENFDEKSQWSTWIYRLSLNVCLTLLKKEKKNSELRNSDAILDEVMEDEMFFTDESLNDLYDAIRELNELDRAIILLYLEQKTYQEIGEIIGLNGNNIGVRITRIKEKLKKLLHGKIY
ncbi:MAG: RNA polymerase sigma-70 factor (ECF subfamily) [Salibacteraceae bacterium]